MNNREAHFYLEELQRMMTQHRGIFSEEFVCASGMAILALEHEQKGWIPCIDRLPDPGKIVLVTDINGAVYAASRQLSIEKKYVWWEPQLGKVRVIAWMPLPQPYQEG